MHKSNLIRDIERKQKRVARDMKICALRNDGLSLRQIAEKSGISINTIRKVLHSEDAKNWLKN